MGTIEQTPRWHASLKYRSDEFQSLFVETDIEELVDLQELVEGGPNWHTLEKIEVRLNNNPTPALTIEESEKL